MASYTVQKVTLAYDEREDRLRLAVEEADGALLTLWLTQRLAGRLVRALVAKLDSRLAAALPDGPLRAASLATLQEWEQAAALARYRPDAPVCLDTPGQEGLIDSIDLADHGDATTLVFRWPAGHDATLRLDATQLRQWLNMLHQGYGRAEWPTGGVWPAWLAEAPAESLPMAVKLMH